MTTDLDTLLQRSAALHNHLCPRQVLGVRMGVHAGAWLGLDLPQSDKRVFTFVETDGCFADGIMAATGCALGRRTMYLMDYGKSAATFIDTETQRAVRIHAHPNAREHAIACQPEAESNWHAMLQAYQSLPAADLLVAQAVRVTLSMEALISLPGLRAICATCGEEIMNAREVVIDGQTFCRACADGAYYAHI